MKRLVSTVVLAAVIVLPFGLAHGVTEIVLDEVTNILGSAASDTVEAGKTIRFTFRLTYTDKPDTALTGSTNGFEVYTAKSVANPETPGFFDAITAETLSITPTWASMFDGGVLVGPTPPASNGMGHDTIGFAPFSVMADGMESGFNQQVWYVETGNLTANDTVCIDSAWYRPSNNWCWSTVPLHEPGLYPDWGGPYCYHVEAGSDVKTLGGPDLPTTYSLSQNYPNPFNPTTEIKFEIPTRSHVTLTVYNVLGQEITTLVDKEMSPGRYVADWDCTSDNGKVVASGIYFYKLEAGDFTETKKMMMLK